LWHILEQEKATIDRLRFQPLAQSAFDGATRKIRQPNPEETRTKNQ
jgi:hypothetical protein